MSYSDSDGEIFEVDYIMDQRGRGKTLEYFIRWKGFGDEEDSWEPARNMMNAKKKVEEFLKGKTPGKTPAKAKKTGSSTSTKEATSKKGTTTKTVSTTYSQSDASSPESSPVLTRRTTTTSKRVEVTSSRGGRGGSTRSVSLRDRLPRIPVRVPRIVRVIFSEGPLLFLLACLAFVGLTMIFEKQFRQLLKLK